METYSTAVTEAEKVRMFAGTGLAALLAAFVLLSFLFAVGGGIRRLQDWLWRKR